MKYAIVGCGVAGTLTCLELLVLGVPPEDILLIDTNFDGGSLGRHWGAIQSNTTWSQIHESMIKYPSAKQPIEVLCKKYQDQNTCLLQDLSWLLFEALQPYFLRCELYLGHCQKIQQQENGWSIHIQKNTHSADVIFLCQGGRCKPLDYGKPILNLDIVFDPIRAKRYLHANDVITVFGTAHSGTLVIKTLLDLGCRVYAIYKGEKPFYYARDNYYDGIKQESAEIADKLQSLPTSQITFVKLDDTSTLCKAIQRSKWIVNATGFEAASIPLYTKENQQISELKYSAETAEIAPNVYGFGLAYPGVTTLEGKTYKDVSIPSFLDQIRRILPTILFKNNAS
jgi:hypothetical protein